MNVLIISIDKGLLGKDPLGDVVERHREYGKNVEGLDIIVLCKKGFHEHEISKNVISHPTNSFAKIFYCIDAVRVAKKLYQKKHYDIVVTQDPFMAGVASLYLKIKFKSKLLVHIHGDFFQNIRWLKENWKNRLLLFVGKIIIRKADGIRVMSSGQREKLIYMGIDEKKIRVISTPIYLEKFQHPNVEQVKNFRHEGKQIILHVGRNDAVKDFKTLLQTIDLVYQKDHNIHFWQVGAGLKISDLHSQFPDVIFSYTGDAAYNFDAQVEPSSLINIYHAVDVVVLTSKSESFGKVLVEANACGKPVVSTATTGAKEIIQDGYNGFLVPIGDAHAIAEKILYLINNPDIARKMGENGKTMAFEKFDGKKNIGKIIAFWKDLTRKPYEFVFERQELKYLIALENADDFIREAHKHTDFDDYSKKNKDNFYGISNLYFDTNDFAAFHLQKNKGEQHVKYRLRTYEYLISDETLVFPEIKKRKGAYVGKIRCSSTLGEFMKIIKQREKDFESMPAEKKKVIKEFIDNAYEKKIEPKAVVVYKRSALVSSDANKLRITVDKDFKAKKYENLFNHDGAIEILPGKCIVEIKFKNNIPLWLKELSDAFQLQEYGGSKYCVSVEKCYNIN